MVSISIELAGIISLSVVSIFWLAGLSFGQKRNTIDIALLWKKHDDFAGEVRRGISDVQVSLARIESRLAHQGDKDGETR